MGASLIFSHSWHSKSKSETSTGICISTSLHAVDSLEQTATTKLTGMSTFLQTNKPPQDIFEANHCLPPQEFVDYVTACMHINQHLQLTDACTDRCMHLLVTYGQIAYFLSNGTYCQTVSLSQFSQVQNAH